MKTLAIVAVSIFASIQLCRADLFGGFVGTWTQEGVVPSSKITTVYKRFERKGLISTTTVIIPGKDKQIGVTRYFDNGKIKGDLRLNRAVQSKLSGTWSISGNSLKAKMKVSAPMVPIFTGTIKTTLVSANKISTLSISENGARSSTTMIRKK